MIHMLAMCRESATHECLAGAFDGRGVVRFLYFVKQSEESGVTFCFYLANCLFPWIGMCFTGRIRFWSDCMSRNTRGAPRE